MNIQQAKLEIQHSVQAYLQKDEWGMYKIPSKNQRPLLLIGPPGIGKTQIMEQIAKECKIGLVSYTITHHTRQSAIGLPFIQKETFSGKTMTVTEYTMSEIIASIYRKMEETGLKEGILFIDEINCVSETLAPTMLQFLQNKTFGNQPVPEGWIIVAAGNPPEYNRSVREFDMVTLDRVRYMRVEADYTVWRQYAVSKEIHPMILSYLELKPNHFYKVQTNIDGMEFVTARGWEDLSCVLKLYEDLGIEINQTLIQEYIHCEDIAEDVAAYATLYKKYQDDYGIQEILQGKVSTTIYQRLFQADFDERISVVRLLLDGLFQQVSQYAHAKALTDLWYQFLKEYRKEIETISYQELVSLWNQRFEQEKKAELLNIEQEHLYQELLQRIQNVHISKQESKEMFMLAKQPFDQQTKSLENLRIQCQLVFENAFAFMESNFQQGQEMVIFVTNLSLHAKTAHFLSENKILAYETYKEKLLIGTQRAQLLEELTH